MKITSVRFRKLASSPSFNHECIEVEALVEDGTTAEQTLSDLKLWVEAQLAGYKDLRSLAEAKEAARHEAEYYGRQAMALKAEVEALRKSVKTIGGEIAKPSNGDDIPF